MRKCIYRIIDWIFVYDREPEFEETDIEFPDISFPSLKEGTDILESRYNEEDKRAKSIETKSRGLLAMNAIVVSLASTDSITSLLIIGLVIGFALLSAVQALRCLRSHNYRRPLEEPKNISAYIVLEKDEFNKEFLSMFVSCVDYNSKINNIRYYKYRKGFNYAVFSVLILAISPILREISAYQVLTNLTNYICL